MPGSDLQRRFGDSLRAMRRAAGMTQAELAKRAASSASVVSRAELGGRLPDRLTTDRLDEALDAGGELVAWWSIAVGAPRSGDLPPAKRWVHNYPAEYHGIVWMRWAAGDGDHSRVDIEVTWGPWRLSRRLRWPAAREVAVWHTKGDDGFSIPVIVRSSTPITASFHLGEPPDEAIDINPGWKLLPPEGGPPPRP